MENFLINKTILNSLDFSPIKQKSRLDITDTNALNLFPGKICMFQKNLSSDLTIFWIKLNAKKSLLKGCNKRIN